MTKPLWSLLGLENRILLVDINNKLVNIIDIKTNHHKRFSIKLKPSVVVVAGVVIVGVMEDFVVVLVVDWVVIGATEVVVDTKIS